MKATSSNKQPRSAGKWNVLPLIYTLPVAAAMGFAALRWGRELKNMIHVLIKLVVKA